VIKMESKNSVELINLTPHDIVLIVGDDRVVIPRSGNILRLPESISESETVNYDGREILLVTKTLQIADARALPVVTNRYYIVSLPIAQAIARSDFLVPDDPIRDSEGRVVGCKRLARITPK
jgi:hypothetical protein